MSCYVADRGHGNSVHFAPRFFVLMVLLEFPGSGAVLLHVIGEPLLALGIPLA